MALYEVKCHLNRCHSEMVWTKEEYRQLQHSHLIKHYLTSVIASIVQQDDCFLPPINIFAIKMGTQLGQEESKSESINFTNIDSVHMLPSAA
jgi:hypothetical protein